MLLPWLFGGADASIEGLGLFWTAGTFAIWLVTVLLGGRRTPVVFPLVGILIALGIGLGVFQFYPWPQEKLKQVAPQLMELRQEFLPGDETAEFPALDGGTLKNEWTELSLSPAPAATRHGVAILIWALASFLIGANLFADPKWSRRMLVALAVNGSLLAFFGIFQSLSWNGAIYWTFDLTLGGSPFGPFVNKNNAGGFLNLTFGCVIATLAMAYSTRLRNLSGPMIGRSRSSRRSAMRSQFQLFFADLNARQLAAFSMVLCVITAILFTLSRGTIVAFLVTSAVFLWMTWRLPVNRVILVLFAALGLGGLWAADMAGVLERLEIRISEAFDQAEKPDDRFLLWQEILEASKLSPWVGTGVGTFSYVMPPHHQRTVERRYMHAENQYLETYQELGAAGVGLLAGVLLLMCLTLFALRRRSATDLDGLIFPVFLAGCVAIVGQMVGSLFDFGLVIPANMILLATLAGMLSGTWIWQRRGYSNWQRSYLRNLFRPALPLLIVVGVGLAWAVREERDAVAASLATQQGMYQQYSAVGDENPYENLTLAAIDQTKANLEKVLVRRPDDLEAHFQLGQVWLLRYQCQAFEDLLKERHTLDLGDLPLWNLTDVSLTQMSAAGFAEEGDAQSLQNLRNDPVVRENLLPALKEFIAARRACGWNADLQLELGWLSWLGQDPLLADQYTAKAEKLAPQFAQNYVDIGMINFNIGKLEAAERAWKRAIELRAETFEEISNLADSRWTLVETMNRLIPLKLDVVIPLSRTVLARVEDQELSRKTMAEILEKTLAEIPEAERKPQDKAMLARLLGNLPEAEQQLQLAIKDDGKQVQHRLDRAQVLLESEQLDEALNEITVCLRLEPRNSRARSLETRIRQSLQKKSNLFENLKISPPLEGGAE